MTNGSTCTVIICAYTMDRWEDLVDAVASVQRQTLPAAQIIVVIDHNPNLYARARSELPGTFVIENHQRRGLSGARNSGVDVASGTIVAFLDDDAVAEPDWLAVLLRDYEEDQVIGVGGAIDPIWCTAHPCWFPTEFLWVVGCTYRGMPTRTSPVRNMIGANMSFRRHVFPEVGGFRTDIGRVGRRPLGCEETELCIRALKRWPNHVMLYDPRARVSHRIPESRTRLSYFWSRCYSEGLSKAIVARIVGAEAGLASERTYTYRTLPAGVAHGLRDTLSGDTAGLSRSAAIAAGLITTVAGYLIGRFAVCREAPDIDTVMTPAGPPLPR